MNPDFTESIYPKFAKIWFQFGFNFALITFQCDSSFWISSCSSCLIVGKTTFSPSHFSYVKQLNSLLPSLVCLILGQILSSSSGYLMIFEKPGCWYCSTICSNESLSQRGTYFCKTSKISLQRILPTSCTSNFFSSCTKILIFSGSSNYFFNSYSVSILFVSWKSDSQN